MTFLSVCRWESLHKQLHASEPSDADWWLISTLLKMSIVHNFCRGNWIGEAPYQHGRPCSQCPPSYGGGCRNNLCHKGEQTRSVLLLLNLLPSWARSVLLQTLSSQRLKTWTRWRSLRFHCHLVPLPDPSLLLQRNQYPNPSLPRALIPRHHLQKLPATPILVTIAITKITMNFNIL